MARSIWSKLISYGAGDRMLAVVVSHLSTPVPLCGLAAWCHKVVAQGDKFLEARHMIRR